MSNDKTCGYCLYVYDQWAPHAERCDAYKAACDAARELADEPILDIVHGLTFKAAGTPAEMQKAAEAADRARPVSPVVFEGVGRKDEPALRFDADKSRVDLIPPEFIEALGRHYGAGAKKYAERNWEKGMSWSRCYASAQRHMLAFWRGEEIDEETGTPHTIAAAWNMAALHWYGLYGRGTDDRVNKVLCDAQKPVDSLSEVSLKP